MAGEGGGIRPHSDQLDNSDITVHMPLRMALCWICIRFDFPLPRVARPTAPQPTGRAMERIMQLHPTFTGVGLTFNSQIARFTNLSQPRTNTKPNTFGIFRSIQTCHACYVHEGTCAELHSRTPHSLATPPARFNARARLYRLSLSCTSCTC